MNAPHFLDGFRHGRPDRRELKHNVAALAKGAGACNAPEFVSSMETEASSDWNR